MSILIEVKSLGKTELTIPTESISFESVGSSKVVIDNEIIIAAYKQIQEMIVVENKDRTE